MLLKRRKALAGRMVALLAVVLGCSVLYYCRFFSPSEGPYDLATQEVCRNKLAILNNTITLYQKEQGGVFPAAFGKFLQYYTENIPWTVVFVCPATSWD